MNRIWITTELIEKQERSIRSKFEQFFGRGRGGFCDWAFAGIELMLQGTGYLTDVDELDENGNFENFDQEIRFFSRLHYQRMSNVFKAAYNLVVSGYLAESATLVRNIIETFVRLKYLQKSKVENLTILALAGHYGFQGKKWNIEIKTMFDEIAPGLYRIYRSLCDIAHGAITSHMLKSEIYSELGKIKYDAELEFKPEECTFITNQYSVYLLAHLVFMMTIFPEIEKKMPESYAIKYDETLSFLWKYMDEFSKKEGKKDWYNSMKNLVES